MSMDTGDYTDWAGMKDHSQTLFAGSQAQKLLQKASGLGSCSVGS
jgi:hypothetical protein